MKKMYHLYKFEDKDGNVLYIGKSNCLSKRIYQHFSKSKEDWKDDVTIIYLSSYECEATRDIMEIYLINKYNAKYNKSNSFGKVGINLDMFESKWVEYVDKESIQSSFYVEYNSPEFLPFNDIANIVTPSAIMDYVEIITPQCVSKFKNDSLLCKFGYEKDKDRNLEKLLLNLFRNVFYKKNAILVSEYSFHQWVKSTVLNRGVKKYVEVVNYTETISKDSDIVVMLSMVNKDNRIEEGTGNNEYALSAMLNFLKQFVEAKKQIKLCIISRNMQKLILKYVYGDDVKIDYNRVPMQQRRAE